MTDTPDTAPRRKVGEIYVRVRTYLSSAGLDADPEQDTVVQLSDPERREWLYMKHLFWCFTNGRTVEICNLKDDPV